MLFHEKVISLVFLSVFVFVMLPLALRMRTRTALAYYQSQDEARFIRGCVMRSKRVVLCRP